MRPSRESNDAAIVLMIEVCARSDAQAQSGTRARVRRACQIEKSGTGTVWLNSR
jgi:hypothetical protein